MTRALKAAGLIGVVMLGIWGTTLSRPAQAAAGINKTINFQGKVVNANGTNVTDGNYTFAFNLYTVASAGTSIWTESKTLAVASGVFQTNLGDVTALPGSVNFNTNNIYLGITFNNDAAGEMSPRIQFTAAAYAFNSDALQGLGAAAFGQLNPASAQSGSLNVTGSMQAATSLQAPLVDTATAVALNIGTGTATSVTIGRTTTPLLMQGNSASTFTATSGSFTTTVGFTAPTAARSINFPDAGGTLCTTTASTCSATYQAAGSYLAKNASDVSSVAVTAAGFLYGFTNSSAAVASGVLKLDNGTNTNSALNVIAAGNPTAGQALILVNNTSSTPSGNLIDLQTGGVSKFNVAAGGNVGIGNNNPSAKLHVTGGALINAAGGVTPVVNSPLEVDVSSSSVITIGENGSGSANPAITLYRTWAGARTGTGSRILSPDATGSLQFQSGTSNTAYGSETYTTNMTIQGNGNVGAGTVAPQQALTLGQNRNFAFEMAAPGTLTMSTATTGGTLAAGTYYYKVTALDGVGETVASPENSQVTTGATSTVTISWTAVNGAASYRIYRGTTAGGENVYYSSTGATFTDTGAASTAATPSTVTTAYVNKLNAVGNSYLLGGSMGIGNSSPQQTLDVTGSLRVTSAVYTGMTGGGTLRLDASGNLTNIGTITSGLINGQTISSAANFTGTVTAATSVMAPLVDTASAGTLSVASATATALALGRTGIITTVNGTAQVGAAAGTGALVNNGSTINTTYAMANLATGGWDAGGAAATVDKYTYISAGQTTAGQTLTIPAPTAATTYGRLLYLTNTGTVSFVLLTTTIGPGSTATIIWANTNGAASWTFAGADGSGILNQNTADQTANFRVSGTGRANTSFTTPLVDSITGALNLGTATATGVTIGGTANTTTITLQGAAGAAFNIGSTAGAGVLTNNSATLNTTLALGNFAAGGSIGTAPTTVDIYTSISVTQTTAGQTLSISSPTASTAYGRLVYLSNIGTTSFVLGGVRVPPGNTATMVWSNTSGAASWQFAGAGASSIENQNTADQTADYRISGTGRANTSMIAPLFDAITGGLNIGTSTATGVTIGSTTNTTAITLQGAAGATFSIGGLLVVKTSSNIVQIGSSTSNNGTGILALNNNDGTTTPTEVDGGMYYNNSTSQFLCGENGFWVNCGVPPRDHSYDLYDEFMSGNSGSLATGAYGIGGLNWYNSLIGAPGTLTYNNNATGVNAPAASADRPGIIDIEQTGTGNGTGQTMSLGVASTLLGTSRIDFKTAVNITGPNLVVLIGLHNETTSATAPTTGVYWKESSAGAWQYCYVNASAVETCGNSAVTATAGSWARLEIVVVSANEIDYYINGTKIAVTGITYNTTNKVAPAFTSYKMSGTPGTLDVYIDYFELLGTTSTAR